jgi:hypothetical protein
MNQKNTTQFKLDLTYHLKEMSKYWNWYEQKNIKIEEYERVITGIYERRYIHKIKIDSTILREIFNMTNYERKYSFNLMMITSDHKVLLLQRTQSFHFPKVVKDLKSNKINFDLIDSLYTSELEKIGHLFFNFMPAFEHKNRSKFVHIFPGGQSNYNEKVLLTLLREFEEETSINIDITKLKFNQSFIFKVFIFDKVIKRTFKNFVFPVKVDMSSRDIMQNFKETKHTRNPTFIDINTSNSLFDTFVRVQNFMLL